METILVGLDGSHRAPGVLRAAQQLAEKFGAALIALRALTIPPEFPAAAATDQLDPLPEHLTDLVRSELSALLQGVPGLQPVAQLVRVGPAWRALLDVADELDVDLIVIGSHGYGGWDRLLGTTAAKVVNLAQCNVLVVHE